MKLMSAQSCRKKRISELIWVVMPEKKGKLSKRVGLDSE